MTARTQAAVARACQWRGKPDRFWTALVEAGFVDELDYTGTGRIHDWREYTGRLVDQRMKNAERKRESRRRPEDVHRTSGTPAPGRPANGTPDVPVDRPVPSRGYQHNQPDRTGPDTTNRTGPNPDNDLNAAAAAGHARAYARETAESPELLAEHLMRIEQERRQQQRQENSSETTSDADGG